MLGEVIGQVIFSKRMAEEDAKMKELIAMLLADKRKIQEEKIAKQVQSKNPLVIVNGRRILITKIEDGKQETEDESSELEVEVPKYKRMIQTLAFLNVSDYIMGYSSEDKTDVEEIEGKTRGELMDKIDEKFKLFFKFFRSGTGLHIREVRGLWTGFCPDSFYVKYYWISTKRLRYIMGISKEEVREYLFSKGFRVSRMSRVSKAHIERLSCTFNISPYRWVRCIK